MSIKIRFLKNQKTKIISAFDTILDCDIDSLKLNINNENVFSFINNKTICTAIIKEYDKSREFFYEHYDVQFLNDISYNYNFNTKHREYCILYIDDIEISGGLCALKRITEQNNILYFEIEILNQIEDLYEKSKGIQLNELGNYNIIWNEDNIKTLLSDEINGFSLVPLNDGESVRQDSINTSIKTIFDTNTIPVAINVNKILNDGLSKVGLSIKDNSFLNSEHINNLWIFDNKSEILEFYQEESQELLDISYEDISYNSIEKYTIKSIESFIGMTGMTGMTGLEYSIYTKKYNSNISPLNIEKKENEKYNFTYKYINTEYDSNFSDYTNKNISSITLVGNTKYNIKINNIDCIINSTNDIDIYRIHTILKFKNTKTNEDEIYNFYSDITPIGTTTNLNIEFEKYIKDNTIVTIYSQEELGILFSNENDKEYDFNITKNIFSYSLKIEKIKNDKIRTIGEELNLFSQIPNISLYDVLSGLQQMFNLVFKITDNTIDAIPLKNYYDKSKYINIDKYVNYDKEIIIKPSIDKANSYRAKEKNITIDCLESIDMRMSFLADLYRNMAYDMETMKEILPVNLRTFNMNVYVLEFRRFNTTFGKLASLLKYNVPIKNKKDPMTRGKDYWNEGHKFLDSTVSMGSLDTYVTAGNQFINTFGGVGGMLLNDKDINVKELEYEFEAVTVHEFELHDCEFDFFSTEPDWMTTISNSDVSAPATAKMIIHPNRVHKVSHYPFFNFVIGEYIMKTLFNEYDIMNMYNNDFIKLDKLPDLYLERHPVQERNDITHSADGIFAEKRQSVYPVSEGYSEKTASAQAYIEQLEKSKELNRSNLQHSILNIGVDAINIGIGKIFENTTPGAVKQVTREGLTSFIPDQINKIL